MPKAKTTTRADLCDAVHQELGLPVGECDRLVKRVFELITEALASGDTVKLSGFGSFRVLEKAERTGRNPKTGDTYPIVSRRVVSYRAADGHKERVRLSNPAR